MSDLLGGQEMVWEKERKTLTAISSDASPLGSFATIITKMAASDGDCSFLMILWKNTK